MKILRVPGRTFRRWISAAWWRTPLYRLTLWGRAPKQLASTLPESGAVGKPGRTAPAGIVSAEPPPWDALDIDRQVALHGFGWIAGAGETDAAPAQALLRFWLERYRRWDPLAWRSDVMGERLYHWALNAALLAPPGDPPLRREFLAAFARQARHLRRVARWETDGIARLRALKGLLTALLALGAGDRSLDSVFRAIEDEIAAQVQRDGGHVSRSPALQLEALLHLVDMRDLIDSARIEVPEPLIEAIDRAARMLRFFRHGDGRLALFNDSVEGDPASLDLALARSGVKGRAPSTAPISGFERLHSGKTLVVMDCGVPPGERWGGHPHAGTLSLELSYGRERLVVNCGAYRGESAAWRTAMRTTAAHSTLVVENTPSSEIDDLGHLGAGPRTVTGKRTEEDGRQWIVASHDGYRARFGLVHARELFLSGDGDDLRGEDRLSGSAGQSFAIRFHLHPLAQASLTQDGSAALLRLPSGAGWRLRVEGAVLSLADSVYLGTGTMRKTLQVVLEGHVGSQGAAVKWAIRREGRRGAEAAAGSLKQAGEDP